MTRVQSNYNRVKENKSKTETSIVVRRSLRTRRSPSYAPKLQTKPKSSSPQPSHLLTKDAYVGTGSDKKLLKSILESFASKKPQSNSCDSEELMPKNKNEKCPRVRVRFPRLTELASLKLEKENIARVLPGPTRVVRLFPSTDMKMVVAANNIGDVGFWNVDAEREDGDGIYLYRLHSTAVNGISIHPFSMSKMFTCCYGGYIQMMDVEKEAFELVYSSNAAIYSVSQRPNDVKSLYFGEGAGWLGVWDVRTGKSLYSWNLHAGRINTIDFNSANANLMATSSSNGAICIWDLRNISAHKPQFLRTVFHEGPVYSAYFSPSGNCLATSSSPGIVGLLKGANYKDFYAVFEKTGSKKIPAFRAMWGWDDSYIFTGNHKGLDIISTTQKREHVSTFESNMSGTPNCFDVNPYKVGMLVGGNYKGQVYMWES